jgi:hypothetical protein
MGGVSSSLVPEAVMAIVCVGVDLAKNVFAIHGVDDVGKAVGGNLGCHAPGCSRRSVICLGVDWLGDLLGRSAPGSPCHHLDLRGQ